MPATSSRASHANEVGQVLTDWAPEAWSKALDRVGDKILDADHGVKGGFAVA